MAFTAVESNLVAQIPSAPGTTSSVAETDSCISNLHIIYDAIQAYKTDHKDLPNSLSELVPDYLADTKTFTCPADHSLAETGKPGSYVYEFIPVPLGSANSPDSPELTVRDWRLKQIEVAGLSVPLVRCFHHGNVLNLGSDGKIYESSILWESALGKDFDVSTLTPESLLNKGSNLEPVKTLTKLELFPYTLQQSDSAKQPVPATDVTLPAKVAVAHAPIQTGIIIRPPRTGNVQGWNPYRNFIRWWPYAAASASVLLMILAFIMNRAQKNKPFSEATPVKLNAAQDTFNPQEARAGLFQLMKQALFQRLYADRVQLLTTQKLAVEKVMELDQRFTSLEKQVILSKEYEKRIDALLIELASARAESRELIQAKIDEIKIEMEKQSPEGVPYPANSRRN